MTRGFTLIEVTIVVAIIAVAATLAVFGLSRSQRRASVVKVASDVRARVQHARDLSMVAGSRIGTARLQLDGSCASAGSSQLWIDLSPPSISIPSALTLDPNGDRVVVSCVVIDVGQVTGGNAAMDGGPARFAFTAEGRLLPGAGAAQAFIRIAATDGSSQRAFRVLASGAACYASEPPPATGCDRMEVP